MQHESKLPGPAQVNLLVWCVEDGTATHDQAKELLREFVRQVDAGKLTQRMIGHMRDCIAAFLDGHKMLEPAPSAGRATRRRVEVPNMEKAFGLTRPTAGGPRTAPDTLAEVAKEVLTCYLAGESLDNAYATVAVDRKARGAPIAWESQIKKAWNSHKAKGLDLLRISKLPDVDPSEIWTPQELKRLTEVFYGELWFTPPGVDATARRDAILWEIDRPDADSADLSERLAAVLAKFDGPPPKKRPAKAGKKNSPKKLA